jgi:hypothetical protein
MYEMEQIVAAVTLQKCIPEGPASKIGWIIKFLDLGFP